MTIPPEPQSGKHPDWLAYDLALLHSANRFDLSGQTGRTASALWLRELFVQVVGLLQPRLVLELGAAEASFSRRVRPLLRKGEAHALEANPHVYHKRFRKAQEAGVAYHNLAVGAATGTASFKLATQKAGQPLSRTKTNNSILEKPQDITYESIEIDMVTVDGFVAEIGSSGRSCAMWIDVEGLAYDVIMGARETLELTKALLVEVEDRPFWKDQHLSHEVKELLCAKGFVPVARDFEYPGQYNVLFLSRDSYTSPFVRLALEQAFAANVQASGSSA